MSEQSDPGEDSLESPSRKTSKNIFKRIASATQHKHPKGSNASESQSDESEKSPVVSPQLPPPVVPRVKLVENPNGAPQLQSLSESPRSPRVSGEGSLSPRRGKIVSEGAVSPRRIAFLKGQSPPPQPAVQLAPHRGSVSLQENVRKAVAGLDDDSSWSDSKAAARPSGQARITISENPFQLRGSMPTMTIELGGAVTTTKTGSTSHINAAVLPFPQQPSSPSTTSAGGGQQHDTNAFDTLSKALLDTLVPITGDNSPEEEDDEDKDPLAFALPVPPVKIWQPSADGGADGGADAPEGAEWGSSSSSSSSTGDKEFQDKTIRTLEQTVRALERIGGSLNNHGKVLRVLTTTVHSLNKSQSQMREELGIVRGVANQQALEHARVMRLFEDRLEANARMQRDLENLHHEQLALQKAKMKRLKIELETQRALNAGMLEAMRRKGATVKMVTLDESHPLVSGGHRKQ